MNSKVDPMGRAIADYWKTKKADMLRAFSPMFEEYEIPLATLFRKYKNMPDIERKSLDMAKGEIQREFFKFANKQNYSEYFLLILQRISLMG